MPPASRTHSPLVSATMISFGSPVELRDYFDGTYRPCQLVGCSKKTIDSYDTSLTLWRRWDGNLPIDQITSRTLSQFAEWLLPGRSPASVNTYLRPIVAMLHYAADEDDIAKAPKYRRLREPIRAPLAFTIDEFTAVLRVAREQDGTVGGILASLWWPSLLCVDFETGLRIRAQLSIAPSDVLLDQGGLYCQAENQKDREADWFPLSEATMNMVQSIYDVRRDRLWPSDVCITCLRQRFRKMMAQAGIYAPKGAGMAFHRTRRSTASYIAAAGGDAQRKMGHSSPRITSKYLDSRIIRSTRGTDLIPSPHPN